MGFNLDDYEPVASRISRFYEAHPDGRIITELVHYLTDTAVFKAEIYIGDVLVSTGWEEEVRGSSHINKSSHLANCETGSVGRALANYNMAGSDPSKRPSREEMSKVDQENKPHRVVVDHGTTGSAVVSRLASEKQINAIKAMSKKAGKLPPQGLDKFTAAQASEKIQELQAVLDAPVQDSGASDYYANKRSGGYTGD
jgi:hypothetical protein